MSDKEDAAKKKPPAKSKCHWKGFFNISTQEEVCCPKGTDVIETFNLADNGYMCCPPNNIYPMNELHSCCSGEWNNNDGNPMCCKPGEIFTKDDGGGCCPSEGQSGGNPGCCDPKHQTLINPGEYNTCCTKGDSFIQTNEYGGQCCPPDEGLVYTDGTQGYSIGGGNPSACCNHEDQKACCGTKDYYKETINGVPVVFCCAADETLYKNAGGDYGCCPNSEDYTLYEGKACCASGTIFGSSGSFAICAWSATAAHTASASAGPTFNLKSAKVQPLLKGSGNPCAKGYSYNTTTKKCEK